MRRIRDSGSALARDASIDVWSLFAGFILGD
jgi:hypothetical protein